MSTHALGSRNSEPRQVGVWLIGARGSISIVTVAGQAAIARGMAEKIGLVTERAELANESFAPIEGFVFGGHEIRTGDITETARALLDGCGVPYLAGHVRDELVAFDERVRPGVIRGVGDRIASMAENSVHVADDASAVATIRADLDQFKSAHGFDRIVVVNLASTEPPAAPHPAWSSFEELEIALRTGESVLPASSLYAYAALDGGDAYVNFTPSNGSRIPALVELAERRGAVHAGADGKTGETLVKSVLGELFARRNLPVLSWFGQNILGNEDGRVLNDPRNKATKIKSKDHLLLKILGYPPQTHVGINYVPSLGEWKIAWDHIHYQGFLGGSMSMQFVWNGVDSLLAAPLILDLVRLCDLAQQRGESGVLDVLASFFKDPMGTDEQRQIAQDQMLIDWVCRR